MGITTREDFQWRITGHVCRACLGRVLMRETFDHKRVYRCSNCGAEREGASENAICCCGITFSRRRRDAGIRCISNPARTAECVAEVVAQQVVLADAPRGPARREPKPGPDPDIEPEFDES